MKRKIALFLGALGTLVLVFMVYDHVNKRSSSTAEPARQRRPMAQRPVTDISTGGDMMTKGEDLRLLKRDRGGRLEAIIHLPEWNKQPDGSYSVNRPKFTIFHKGGEQTHVSSSHGSLVLEDISDGVSVRRGSLSGDVRIWVDLSTDPEPVRTPMEQRLGQIVRIHADHLDFDNDMLRVHTASAVSVFSSRADVFGTGLDLRWRESPRELLWLEIKHGSYMAVYDMPSDMGNSMPGASSTPGNATASETAQTTTSSVASHSRPVESGPADDQPAIAEANARNIYKAVFRDSVRVDYPQTRNGVTKNGYLSGANMLSLEFEWDEKRSSRRSFTSSPSPVAPVASAQTAPAQVRTQAQTQAVVEHASQQAPGEALAQDQDEKASPMIITWSGPLVLQPTGYTETPTSDRYAIAAQGPRLIMSDGVMIATGTGFVYESPQQQGHLEGDGQTPAGLVLEDGRRAVAQKMTFNRKAGVATLIGEGFMVNRPQSEGVIVEIEAYNDKLDPSVDYIKWNKDVDLSFEVDSAGKEHLTRAVFNGDVMLAQAPSAESPVGDWVKCHRLDVQMARDAEGKSYPQLAVATGDARACQQGSSITAGIMTVTFARDDAAGDTAAAAVSGMQMGRFKPISLEAQDNVIVKDDSRSEPMEARAESLVANLVDRSAILYGQLARISQGSNVLCGRTIHLSEANRLDGQGKDQNASVSGEGWIDFLAKRDLNGRDLPKPRPLRIDWTESMRYEGPKNTAEFRGNVRLDGKTEEGEQRGVDHMQCDTMLLTFEEAAQKPPAKSPPKKARGAFGMDDYSRRKISAINADGNVQMMSCRVDPQDVLLRRMNVTGSKLVYDAIKNKTDVSGQGAMLIEDYQHKPGKPAQGSIELQSPYRAAFWWDKVMTLTRNESSQTTVVLDGNAALVFHSGQYVDRGAMNLPIWPVLKSGRITTLRGDMLSACFAKADDEPATGGEGPRIGELERFMAQGDVHLEDGLRQKRTISCQRLDCDNRDGIDLVIADGMLPGRPLSDAVMTLRDLDAGKRQETRGQRIVWYRKTNRVEIQRVRGGGLR